MTNEDVQARRIPVNPLDRLNTAPAVEDPILKKIENDAGDCGRWQTSGQHEAARTRALAYLAITSNQIVAILEAMLEEMQLANDVADSVRYTATEE